MIKYAEKIDTYVKVDYTALANKFLHRDDMLDDLLNMEETDTWECDEKDGTSILVYCEYNHYHDEDVQEECRSASYEVYVAPNKYITVNFTLTIEYDVDTHYPHIDLTPEDVEVASITL